MKLELKLLAPYLPYGIKIGMSITFYSKGNKINMFRKITLVVTNLKSILKNPKEYKLILRPLSDFEKVIAKELMIKFNCSLKIVEDVWKLIQGEIKLGDISYKTYLMMCENHLDFNNLIEKGLAIDINTLKQ